MDKKKSFGKKVIRNNVEVMNQLPGDGYDNSYRGQNQGVPMDYGYPQ